eukprot:366036-Chlamydomonas_euryale.AAC.2
MAAVAAAVVATADAAALIAVPDSPSLLQRPDSVLEAPALAPSALPTALPALRWLTDASRAAAATVTAAGSAEGPATPAATPPPRPPTASAASACATPTKICTVHRCRPDANTVVPRSLSGCCGGRSGGGADGGCSAVKRTHVSSSAKCASAALGAAASARCQVNSGLGSCKLEIAVHASACVCTCEAGGARGAWAPGVRRPAAAGFGAVWGLCVYERSKYKMQHSRNASSSMLLPALVHRHGPWYGIRYETRDGTRDGI